MSRTASTDGADQSPPRPAATWTVRAIRILLTLLVTWFILDRVGVSVRDAIFVGDAMPDPSPGLLLASAGLLFLGFSTSAWFWGRMVLELGGTDPGVAASLRIVLAANLGRYLPGKVWQIAGLAVLARRAGVEVRVATAAALMGQGFSLAAAAALGAPMLLGRELGEPRALYIAAVALGAFALVVSVPAVLRFLLGFGVRVTRGDPGTIPALGASFGPRWLVLYLLGWGLYGGAFLLFVRGLGLGGSELDLVTGFSAAYLMGYVALFAPAGIGVREGFLVAFLEPAVGSAVVALAVLTRLWMTVVEVVPAVGFAFRELRRVPEVPGRREDAQ